MQLHAIKISLLLVVSIVVTNSSHAQKNTQTAGKAQINWLISLMNARKVAVVTDSIKAKHYKIIAMQGGKGNNMGLRMVYEMNASEQFGLASSDAETVTACFINTPRKELFDADLLLLPAMGFKPNTSYKSSPDDKVYSRGNDVLIFKTINAGDKVNYAIVATKLVL